MAEQVTRGGLVRSDPLSCSRPGHSSVPGEETPTHGSATMPSLLQ